MNDLIPDTCPVYCRTLMRSNGMNSASEEYGSILRPLGRAAEQVQQYPKSLQCTPAIPLVEPMIASPKDQRKQSVLPRPQRKVELLNGQILSFSDIADFYSDCLPISTRVYGGGFYGVSGELTIGENETLYIHTALKVDVAIAEISHNRKYNIPVTFGVPFGIVYNPSNNAAAAIEGHLFESIESILSGKELPKIIRMECNTIDTAGCVVNYGEILIVKGSPAPMQLNVYNLSTGATSTLCKGSFSANPHLMKMSLQQIHQFAHDLLPCQVVLCCEDYPNVNPPSHLASCIFTIKEFKNTTTLLITSCLDADISKLKVMELPSNLQFQVQITGTDTWSSLAKTTKIISDSYPNLPDLYRYLGMPNEKMRQGQLFFYGVGSCSTSENDDFSSNNTSSENDYVVMNRPAGGPLSPSHGVLSHANTKDFPNECQNKQQEKESSTPGNDYITILPAAPVYQTIQSQLPQDSGSLPPPPQPKKRAQGAGSGSSTLPRTSPRYAEVSQVPTSVASSIPPAPRQVSSAQATSVAPRITPRPRPQVRSNELLGSVAKMSGSVPESATATPVKPPVQTSIDAPDAINQLTLEVLRLRQEWADMKCKMNGVVEMVRQICDKPDLSYMYLDTASRGQPTLSVDDVVALLQSAGLEQYETMFRKESIDGDVFCELDEQTLEKELSVALKIHRLRFMRLIREQRSLRLQF